MLKFHSLNDAEKSYSDKEKTAKRLKGGTLICDINFNNL